jgi:hypothetical protein
MTIKKRTGKKSIPTWDTIVKEIHQGQRGGKSQASIPLAMDIISIFANPISKTTSYQNTSTGNNTGSWTVPDTNGSLPYTAPYQNPYVPTTNEFPHQWQTYPFSSPQKEKPKHDPKELMGKMVAYATVRMQGIEHTGVLFVRRCGAWKLIDCISMNKVASGSEKAPLPDVTIHYIIYTEENDKSPRPKSRFDDIDMRIDEDGDNDGDGIKT